MEDLKRIIKGAVAEKKKCQQELYDMYATKMYGLCLQYAKDYDEAQDILQEGFIKIFKNLKQFNFQGSFDGWVRRIIINSAIERFRKKNYLYPLVDEMIYNENLVYEDIIDNASAKELISLVQKLSPQYRVVFNLYAIEGYSHKEISEKLGISEGTSKSNLSRARNILQEKINKFYRIKVKAG